MGRKHRLVGVAETPLIAWFVREGRSISHAGVDYQGGDRFDPFDSLPLELQNLHLPNLERREVFPFDEDPLINEAFAPTSPEAVVEVLTQEQAEDGDLL